MSSCLSLRPQRIALVAIALAALTALVGSPLRAEPITWESLGPPSTTIHDLEVDPVVHSMIYAATNSGVFRSTNAGLTWSLLGGGLPASSMGAIAIDPANHCIVYAGADAGDLGIFRSMDCGATWTPINSSLGNLIINVIAIDPTDPSRVYVGTNGGGVFMTSDRGDHWFAPITPPAGDARVLTIVADPKLPAHALLGTQGGGVFRSLDAGGTWTECNAGIPTFPSDPNGRVANSIVMNDLDPGLLYVAFRTGGVYRSKDGGDSWAAVNGGLPPNVIDGAQSGGGALSLAWSEGALFLAAMGQGVLQLEGESWADVTFETAGHPVRTLAPGRIRSAHHLYAGSQDAGVFGARAGGCRDVFLDGNANSAVMSGPTTQHLDLPQGTYTITVGEDDFNYALGLPFTFNDKVLMFAVTNGDPTGHLWVLQEGVPLLVSLIDTHNVGQPVRVYFFFPEETDDHDNTGSADISVTSADPGFTPATVHLDGNDNFVNLQRVGTRFLDLAQGTHTFGVVSNFNYALGLPFAYDPKVLLLAVTNGNALGHAWVLKPGTPATINLTDTNSPNDPIRIYLVLPEGADTPDNTGGALVSIDCETATVVATLAPATLNRASNGKFVTLYLEVQGGSASDIDPSTILLNGSIAPIDKSAEIADHDADGIPELILRFNRPDIAALPLGANEVAVTGAFVGGTAFEATATIRIIDPSNKAGRITLDVLSAPLTIPVRMSVSGPSTGGGEVRLYDVRGRLVRAWKFVGELGRRVDWDGTRADGTRAGSGLYFARVEMSSGERATSKIVIAR